MFVFRNLVFGLNLAAGMLVLLAPSPVYAIGGMPIPFDCGGGKCSCVAVAVDSPCLAAPAPDCTTACQCGRSNGQTYCIDAK